MPNAVYEELAYALNARGTTIPAVLCDEYFALVQFLLTPEEAAVACAMPLGFATAKEIAAEMGTKDMKTLARQLDRMGDKGLVHIRWRDGKKLYEFPPLIPGLVEFQFMSGRIDEHSKKMADLLNDYRRGAKKAVLSGAFLALNASAKSKKIMVDQPVVTTFTVLPYKDVLELIGDTEYICVGTCTCKQMGNLSGNPCSRPSDVCMMFGESALHAIVKGFPRRLSKKEAIEKLDIAEEAGLVHNYMNNPGHYSNFLCNCCQCHCMVLRGIKKAPVPNSMIIARYSIEIDEQRCTGCGACIERCQMEALGMRDGKPVKQLERCIGCGLCMYVCQSEALILRPLEAAAIPLRKCWWTGKLSLSRPVMLSQLQQYLPEQEQVQAPVVYIAGQFAPFFLVLRQEGLNHIYNIRCHYSSSVYENQPDRYGAGDFFGAVEERIHVPAHFAY